MNIHVSTHRSRRQKAVNKAFYAVLEFRRQTSLWSVSTLISEHRQSVTCYKIPSLYNSLDISRLLLSIPSVDWTKDWNWQELAVFVWTAGKEQAWAPRIKKSIYQTILRHLLGQSLNCVVVGSIYCCFYTGFYSLFYFYFSCLSKHHRVTLIWCNESNQRLLFLRLMNGLHLMINPLYLHLWSPLLMVRLG